MFVQMYVINEYKNSTSKNLYEKTDQTPRTKFQTNIFLLKSKTNPEQAD